MHSRTQVRPRCANTGVTISDGSPCSDGYCAIPPSEQVGATCQFAPGAQMDIRLVPVPSIGVFVFAVFRGSGLGNVVAQGGRGLCVRRVS